MMWWIVFILLAGLLVYNAENKNVGPIILWECLFPMKRWKVTKAGILHKCTDNNWKMYFARDAKKWYSFEQTAVYCGCQYIKPPAKINQIIKLIEFEDKIKHYGTS